MATAENTKMRNRRRISQNKSKTQLKRTRLRHLGRRGVKLRVQQTQTCTSLGPGVER